MDSNKTEAIKHLISHYSSDLTYIVNFQKCKNGQISTSDFAQNNPGSFKSFIIEFSVNRNVEKNKTEELLQTTLEWVKSSTPNDVDGFAQHLKNKGLTHGKTALSLASKLLFLNDPWGVIPLDRYAKKAVGMKTSVHTYSDYSDRVNNFKKHENRTLFESLDSINHDILNIEKHFLNEIKDISTIRYNRLLDKLLWVIGKD
jgi:hypothetical protein